MGNNKQALTSTEKAVMELLWEEARPLTSSEIVSLSVDKSWKPSYIHLVINSLLKKNYIEIAEFKQTTKNFARAFVPTMTQDELIVRDVLGKFELTNDTKFAIISHLIRGTKEKEQLDNIIKLCEEQKKIQ